MQPKRALVAVHLLLLAVLACNLQAGPGSQPDLPGTITAQAPADAAGPPTATAVSGVEVSVTSDTNCRTGPSQAFDRVFVVSPGQKFKVVGKNTPTNYWIIENPAGGTCWLWGRYAVLTGDTSILLEYPSPATPAANYTNTPKPTRTPEQPATPTEPAAPAGPSGMAFERQCEAYIANDGITPRWREEISLSWQDNASDETGYRMYRNNSPLPDLPPGPMAYHFTENYNQGTGGTLFIAFRVEAFNNYGSSPPAGIDVPKCP